MDLPGILFNMASERIVIEHNVFETVSLPECALLVRRIDMWLRELA